MMTPTDIIAAIAASIALAALLVSIYTAYLTKRSADASSQSARASEASAGASQKSADAAESSVRAAYASYKAANVPQFEVAFGVEKYLTEPRWWVYIKLLEGPPDLWVKEKRHFIYMSEKCFEEEHDESMWVHLSLGRAVHGRRTTEEHQLQPLPAPLQRAILVLELTSVSAVSSPEEMTDEEAKRNFPWKQEIICNWNPAETSITY